MKATKKLYKTFEIIPVVTTAIYAAGDVLFNTTELALAFPNSGGIITLEEVFVFDRDAQGAEMDLIFLNTAYDLGAVNSPFDILDAEATAIQAHITLATWEDMTAFHMAWIRPPNVGEIMKAAAASQSLYVGAITQGTPTHSVGGLTVRVVVSHQGTT